LGAIAGLIAVTVFAVVTYSERDSAPPSSSAPAAPIFDAPPVASSGGQPDLSRMKPREAADRLFNRIMMASEQGDRAEALRFVPMAIQAYGGLLALDRDAHYHLGLIHGVASDRANVDRQIAALRQGAPNHLLALVLEHGTAERSGDRAAVSRVLTAFAAAYDTEVATRRPEYEAHRNTIERFRVATASRAAPSTAEPVGAAQEGAALFATNCAACHGPGAAGSDKGPPLVHKIYEPSHHHDGSFYRAVRQGVRSHHWSLGDMPPVPGVSDGEVGRIIAYVRELQRAAGIR
jgi:mono/diheme cytochrome c family protein